jgi:hypothetical protein
MIPAKVQMATKAHTAKRAFKQSNKPRLSALPSEPEVVHEHASIDSLDVLEEAMKFFLQRASEASDEKAAKRFARYADRALKTLALYHPFYHRLSRTKRGGPCE